MNENENEIENDRDSDLQALVKALDAQVPREGAWIQMVQYGGGPDESQMLGNLNGYRRFGIEFLKATLNHEPGKPLHVALEELLSPDSTIEFGMVEVSDKSQPTPVSRSWKDRWVERAVLLFLLVGFVVFLIGVGTVCQWIFS